MIKYQNGWTKKKVIKHIEDNFRGKSVDKCLGVCEYQGKNGKRCAVGLFLPKKHEALKFNGGVDGLLNEYPDLFGKLPFDKFSLRQLQQIHDGVDEKGEAIYTIDDIRNNIEILSDMINYIEAYS